MNLQATITAIEYHLPSEKLTNEDLCASFPDWSMDKIEKKTGIRTRHISGPDEFASDLAVTAAQKLFRSGACKPQDIDFVLFCTPLLLANFYINFTLKAQNFCFQPPLVGSKTNLEFPARQGPLISTSVARVLFTD